MPDMPLSGDNTEKKEPYQLDEHSVHHVQLLNVLIEPYTGGISVQRCISFNLRRAEQANKAFEESPDHLV